MDYDRLQETIISINPFVKTIGLEILEIQEGYAKGRIRMQKMHENSYGGMHGGCVYALADTMAGIAAITYGNFVCTIDGKMNYLQPVMNTDYVNCEAKMIRQGGRIGYYQTTITDDNGKLLATADFSYYKMKEKVFDDTNV